MINLSVIVPFFNEEQFLDESVNRLLSNDIYTSIYLIDNNSTDNSYEIAKNLASNNEKIELFKTGKNKGKGSALAFSKNLIQTSHVVIHDADLEYFPEDIIEMFDLAKQNQKSPKELTQVRDKITSKVSSTLGKKMDVKGLINKIPDSGKMSDMIGKSANKMTQMLKDPKTTDKFNKIFDMIGTVQK